MTLRECFDRHGCDRGSRRHCYDRVYENLPEPKRMLEVGIFKGAGIASWLDYWPNTEIVCLDTFQRVAANAIPVLRNERVTWWKGDSRVMRKIPGQFDLIIDDGDHSADAQRQTFENLFPSLSKDGAYFIEDVWPDRVGYMKLLETIGPHRVTFHDLRTPKVPDSFVLEIRHLC